MHAENLNLIGLVGATVRRVTIWRNFQRVVYHDFDGRRVIRTKCMWSAMNALERDLAGTGWRLQIDNTCRSEWSR